MRCDPDDEGVDRARRNLWRAVLGGVLVARDELRGIPQLNLSELGAVPDAVLAEMVPVWKADMALEIRDDGVYRAAPGRPAACVHAFAPHEKRMVDQYACGRNIRTIADYAADDAGLDSAAAFQAARALFVRLCQAGVCHPAAAHAIPGDAS